MPVMTENVLVSCDADNALWNYNPTGVSPQSDVPNPVDCYIRTTGCVINDHKTNFIFSK